MSARTRSISAADCAALVEKPPTSISISVTPSLRLEKRLPSRADPPSCRRRTSSRCPRSPASAPAPSRRAACPSPWRTPSAGAPRCARGSSSDPPGPAARRRGSRRTRARSAKPVRTSLTSVPGYCWTRTARSSRNRSPGGQAIRAAHVDQDAQVLQPGHALAQLIDGDDAGRRTGQQLLDVAAQMAIEIRRSPGRRDRQQERDRPQQLAVPQRPGDEAAGEGSWGGCGFGRHVGEGADGGWWRTMIADRYASARVRRATNQQAMLWWPAHALSSLIAPGSSTSPAGGGLRSCTARCWPTPTRPVSAYAKLGRGPYSFLLESVVGGDKWAAYSFAGVRPRAVMRARGSSVEVLQPRTTTRLPRRRSGRRSDEPLRFVDDYLAKLTPAVPPGLPRFFGGAVGWLGYDIVRSFERLPSTKPDDLGLPELCFAITDTVVVFDNLRGTVKVVASVDVGDGGRPRARLRRRLRAHRGGAGSAGAAGAAAAPAGSVAAPAAAAGAAPRPSRARRTRRACAASRSTSWPATRSRWSTRSASRCRAATSIRSTSTGRCG